VLFLIIFLGVIVTAKSRISLFTPSWIPLSTHQCFAIPVSMAFALLAAPCPAIAEDCTTSNGKWTEERPRNCLQDPGWLDIGAGIVVVKNAGISQQNGVGNLVTLRAYPFGRWYAPLRSPSPASNDLVKSKIESAITKNTTATDEQKDADKDAREAVVLLKEAAGLAKTDTAKAPEAAKSLTKAAADAETAAVTQSSDAEALATAANALVKAAVDARAPDLTITAATKAANKANDAKRKADRAAALQKASDIFNADAARGMQTVLNEFGNNYALEELDGIHNFGRRVSVFLGRSVGGFDANVVNGDINAFGIAIDIAPEFSIVWGHAYFNLPAQTGVANSSKSGTIFGVQINLNAFKAMRGLTGSL
jgi:hypothetical protein